MKIKHLDVRGRQTRNSGFAMAKESPVYIWMHVYLKGSEDKMVPKKINNSHKGHCALG